MKKTPKTPKYSGTNFATKIILIGQLILVLVAVIPSFFPLLSVYNSLTEQTKLFVSGLDLSFGDSANHLLGNGFLLIGYFSGWVTTLIYFIFCVYFFFSKKSRSAMFLAIGFAIIFLVLYLLALIISPSLFLASNPSYGINEWEVKLCPLYFVALSFAIASIIYSVFTILYIGIRGRTLNDSSKPR